MRNNGNWVVNLSSNPSFPYLTPDRMRRMGLLKKLSKEVSYEDGKDDRCGFSGCGHCSSPNQDRRCRLGKGGRPGREKPFLERGAKSKP
jgi:hypothetical protein